ncbi:MAG TPA: hypothetical protein VIZ43_29820 [Trebonia sp.]
MRLGVGEVERDGQGGDRDEQRGDDRVEDDPGAAELEAGETVAGEGRQGGRPGAAERRVQGGVAEPLDERAVPVDVLEQQPERVEELKRAGEPETERLEDVGLGLGRVDEEPGDRDQREQREQERERGQQGDRAARQPVQLDRDLAVALREALPPPALAAGVGGVRRRSTGAAAPW